MKRSLFLALVLAAASLHAETKQLLNVSYDVTREFYAAYNPLFAQHWKEKTGAAIQINQSHSGSSQQARSVLEGLEASVVTMNQATDIDVLASKGHLVSADWAKKFPHGSAPYSSTIVFLVREGNPKGIKDWADLVKPGVGVIIPNPKTSGNGRYSFLAAWGYASQGADETKAREFVSRLFKNVPVLDAGGRGATNTFVKNGIGDVLLTFENEAHAITQQFGTGKIAIVYPSISVRADAPVAVVDAVADRLGTRAEATEYLQYLYSPAAQELLASKFFRPGDEAVLSKHSADFPALRLLEVEKDFGGWAKVQEAFFKDGGVFDQLAVK